jgi:hypothetical protein
MISMDKKYKTREGKPVRLLCVDRLDSLRPIVGLVMDDDKEEILGTWTQEGKWGKSQSDNNLVEVTEWDDFKIDDPVMVRDWEDTPWFKRHFARVENNNPTVWRNGTTSWSAESTADVVYWKHIRKPTAEELGKK